MYFIPGARLSDIRIKIDGAEELDITANSLEIYTRFGFFSEIMPVSYRMGEGGTKDIVKFNYVNHNGLVGFEATEEGSFKDAYLIDPELVFSTYAGNSVDNFGFTATYDSLGSLYAGGIATSPSFSIPNGRYPVTAGAFDVTFNGGQGRTPANLACDIAISKYDSSGSILLYATYLGGSDDEYPHRFNSGSRQ